MADKTTIQTIAQLAFNRINPRPNGQEANPLGEYIETGKIIYGEWLYIQSKEERRNEGEWQVPSQLLIPDEIEVIGNKADISHLHIMRTLPGDLWIQNIGNGCEYTRLSQNDSQMYDMEHLENSLPYTVLGQKILFPKGIHGNKNKISIVYAGDGTDIDEGAEIEYAGGSYVLGKLLQIYGNKAPEDKTNNNNPNN